MLRSLGRFSNRPIPVFAVVPVRASAGVTATATITPAITAMASMLRNAVTAAPGRDREGIRRSYEVEGVWSPRTGGRRCSDTDFTGRRARSALGEQALDLGQPLLRHQHLSGQGTGRRADEV